MAGRGGGEVAAGAEVEEKVKRRAGMVWSFHLSGWTRVNHGKFHLGGGGVKREDTCTSIQGNFELRRDICEK